ncbi:MAG TPA: Cupredoxin [Burkholderiales bacterium]|nr:Cupredoxin [Burkholderiales bacterium]
MARFNMKVMMVSLGFALASALPVAHAAGVGGPVYVHTNGANDFLESIVVVKPGQKVVFVNEDTGDHTIRGYNQVTGKLDKQINGLVNGTPGYGHPVSTYTVSFKKPGIYMYYCSVHAHLKKVYHNMVAPVMNKGIHGYGAAMAGEIVVTRDSVLAEHNPPSSHFKILKDYFGG